MTEKVTQQSLFSVQARVFRDAYESRAHAGSFDAGEKSMDRESVRLREEIRAEQHQPALAPTHVRIETLDLAGAQHQQSSGPAGPLLKIDHMGAAARCHIEDLVKLHSLSPLDMLLTDASPELRQREDLDVEPVVLRGLIGNTVNLRAGRALLSSHCPISTICSPVSTSMSSRWCPNLSLSTVARWSSDSNEVQAMSVSQKQQVIDLLKSIETGDPAPVAFINPDKYIQHNLAVADGLAGFGAVLQQLPKGSARANTVRVFEDGDFVFAHTEYDFFGPKVGFDVFRFEGGRIVEHWDNLQETPAAPNPSGHTMLDGERQVKDLGGTEANKGRRSRFCERHPGERPDGEAHVLL